MSPKIRPVNISQPRQLTQEEFSRRKIKTGRLPVQQNPDNPFLTYSSIKGIVGAQIPQLITEKWRTVTSQIVPKHPFIMYLFMLNQARMGTMIKL